MFVVAPDWTSEGPALAVTDGCAPPEPGGHRLAVDDRERTYEIAVPDGDLNPAPWPLVVALHGTGGSGSHFGDASGVAPEGSANGALVVLPDGMGDPTGWLHEDRERDLAFVDAVIDEMVASGCVDADRLWVTGVSAGSVLAARLVCRRPDVAGAVLVAGLPRSCDDISTDVYVVHGTADDIIPYGGGDFNGVDLATMPEVVAGWASAAGCDATPAGRGVEPDVFALEWSGCTDAVDGADGVVHLYSVVGGGHGWFTDGAAAVDATCLVVTGATSEPGQPPDMSACEG